jgi:hypothetical protein
MGFCLLEEIKRFAQRFGIHRLGFLTLTFADHVLEIKEAQRRFHSLNTGVLKGRYERGIAIWERQKSGRLHFHLLLAMNGDIRCGSDFEAFQRRDYRSANHALRVEWAFWRKTAPKYGFGRTELLPVKSTTEGIAKYIGKYVSKHIGQRQEADRGARVVRFLGFKPGDRTARPTFAWNSDRAWLWRRKLKLWAAENGFDSMEALRKKLGHRWAWKIAEMVVAYDLTFATTEFPSALAGQIEYDRQWSRDLLENQNLRGQSTV